MFCDIFLRWNRQKTKEESEQARFRVHREPDEAVTIVLVTPSPPDVKLNALTT